MREKGRDMGIGYQEIRREIARAGRRILAAGQVTGTWGNISVRLPDDSGMAITPSGVAYETLGPADIVLTDWQGRPREGALRPSVESPLHAAVYRARPDLGALVHTHSPAATAFAMARKPIPPASEDLVQAAGGEVRVAEYHLPGTPELGDAAVQALDGRSAVLLASHGCLGGGRHLAEALRIVGVVEKAAHSVILAEALGGAVCLSPEDVAAMRAFYLESYGQG